MSAKKIQTILSLLEIAEININNAKQLTNQLLEDIGGTKSSLATNAPFDPASIVLGGASKYSREEETAKEVVEGHFDGEYMIGDNGQTYIVPQNYASKTQLVVGDRMKWILTSTREIFKLIQPIDRERVEGTFHINGENYLVTVPKFAEPVKVLKASATFAMKTQELEIGDTVAITVPKSSTNPRWGALVNVIKSTPGGVSKVYDSLESISTAKAEDDILGEINYL